MNVRYYQSRKGYYNHLKEKTIRKYTRACNDFSKTHGLMQVKDFIPFHVPQ
jgi:hypothetical protein